MIFPYAAQDVVSANDDILEMPHGLVFGCHPRRCSAYKLHRRGYNTKPKTVRDYYKPQVLPIQDSFFRLFLEQKLSPFKP